MAETGKRLGELLAYLDETRARLLATVREMNAAFTAVRPRAGTWSAAEIVAHLAVVEGGVARLVEKSIEWARSHDIGPNTSDESIMSSLDEFHMEAPLTRIEAPDIVVPPPGQSMEDSLASLKKSRARLREALIGGSDLDLCKVTRPHRVLGEINLYQWALFVGQHEERHRKQIERTIRQVTELAAECAPIV